MKYVVMADGTVEFINDNKEIKELNKANLEYLHGMGNDED